MTIKDFRIKRDETQKEFARELGVSIATVRDWEQGRRTPDRRSRIALEKAGFDLEEWDKEQKK